MAPICNKKPHKLAERVFIRPSELQSRYGIAKSTGYAWLREGRFPPIFKLGPRLSAWKRSDLDKFFGLGEDSN